MTEASTIFALSSAPGRSGVAVFRVSGPAAGAVLDAMAPPRPKPRRAAVRAFAHPATGEAIDQGLALWFPAPASFTGEDAAEFHTHGGRAVIAAMLAALGSLPGCRMAEPGEFARRAFEAGKIDLAEAEGLADLIDAETNAQRRQALRQAGGALSALYGGWRTKLIEATALVEAAIDFSDEGDVAADALARAGAIARDLAGTIARHLNDGHRGEILRAGFRVVIAGPPNAGKSSLLNALARRDVAIVSAEAGTTRDVIEVRLDLDGLPVVLVDTAGLREAEGEVEREGIRRAIDQAREADLVVWLTEAGSPPAPPPDDLAWSRVEILGVTSKSDLSPAEHAESALAGPRAGAVVGWVAGWVDLSCEAQRLFPDGALLISTKTGAGLDALIRALADKARARLGESEEPAITQERHRAHLATALAALNEFQTGAWDNSELRAEDLRQAAAALGRVTGRVDPEEVLGQIFQRFCIGK